MTTLDPSLVKAGEMLLAQALESHREICKSLITTTTAALTAYAALLGFVVDPVLRNGLLKSNPYLAVAPVILFAVAASLYVCGYFHRKEASASLVLQWLERSDAQSIREAIFETVKRRWRYLWGGNIFFWLAVVTALYALYTLWVISNSARPLAHAAAWLRH